MFSSQNDSFSASTKHRLDEVAHLEVREHLHVLRRQEHTSYRFHDYLRMMNDAVIPGEGNNSNKKNLVDENCRNKMSLWCYQVVDFCKFHRDTAALAVSLLDRFMCTPVAAKDILTDRKTYQLAAMTCLYIVVKVHEGHHASSSMSSPALDISLLAKLGRGKFCEAEFEEMEITILCALEWKINGPTTLSFVDDLITLLLHHCNNDCDEKSAEIMKGVARRQAELTMSEYFFIKTYLPSEIALAAVCNAMSEVNEELIPALAKNRFLSSIELCYPESVIDADRIRETQTRLKLLFMGLNGYDDESPINDSTSSSKTDASCSSPQSCCKERITSDVLQQFRNSPVSATAL